MREWLKSFRNNKKLTQKIVAKKAGISRSFYTEIENDIKDPSVTTAKKIAETLGFNWIIFFESKSSKLKQENHGRKQSVTKMN